jgi:hypothetical protein
VSSTVRELVGLVNERHAVCTIELYTTQLIAACPYSIARGWPASPPSPVVCLRTAALFVARKNEQLRTNNATLRLPLASARSGIVDVAANRHPICNSLLRLYGNVCRRRQGRVHPRPDRGEKEV